MRLLIVTEAWYPQINGVVRTLTALRDQLQARGFEVMMITPDRFNSVPCPTYSEIQLALVSPHSVGRLIKDFRPTAIHISTEGPLGLAARRFCLRQGLPFTTAFHTRFPEYIEARLRIPADWIYPLLRWFHGRSSAVMAPTPTVVANLHDRGFRNVRLWGRGVDTGLFRPDAPKAGIPGNGPVLLYVGRVAIEKNIRAFLDLRVEGTKVVVGDGPQRQSLQKSYPNVLFAGARHGEDLVSYYNAADVFVFPSRTDTFGLVMLEALACGVPVAAYPVMGPLDVVTDARVGCLHEDLGQAVEVALTKQRSDCRAFAEQRSWAACAETFHRYLHQFDSALLPEG